MFGQEIDRRATVVILVAMLVSALPWASGAGMISDGDEGGPGPIEGSRVLPAFTNVSDSVGLAGKGGSFFTWADYNSDGYMDFQVNGKTLYENSGPPGFTFTDVTAVKGLSAAGGKGIWGDYDNDGDMDLYVANWNDKLYENQGPPNYDFVDVTVAAGDVRDGFPGTAASWGDLDMDGDLDLYVVNGEVWSTYTHYPDTLWINNGDGTFTNVTESAGVNTSKKPHYGRGAIWGDYDNDGWQDLYISNYRLQFNFLWYNNRNGTFDDRAKDLDAAGFARNQQGDPGGNYYGHTIGSSFADLNNDGWLDIFVSNLVHKDPDRGRYCDDSNVYVNNGYPYWNFTDIRKTSGIPIKPVGGVTHGYYDDENYANAAMADFDNDGYMDIYIPQVYKHSWMYSYLYHNQGDSTWKNVSDVLGLHNVTDTYAGAWADYDNDGDMDLITAGRQNEWNKTDITTPVRIRLYRNEGNSNNWLKVNLTGVESNRNGVGAQVRLHIGDRLLFQQVETGMGSHGQQNDMRLNFGLGTDTTVDTIEVRWPTGIVQVLTNVAANQQVNITEDTTGPRITSISGYQTTTPDNEVTVQGTATGDVSTYHWDHEGDMEFDWSGATNQAQTFMVRGTWEYHPTFKVMNTAGDLGFIRTTRVFVDNVPPVADLGEDMVAWEDEEVWFDASGTTDTLWDRANMTFQYFFNDGTNTSQISDELVNHTYPNERNYTVRVDVRDPFGALSSDNVTVQVRNVAPTVEIVANDTVLEDVEMTFNATGNDTVSDIAVGLEYRWDLDDGTELDWSTDPEVAHTFTASGEYNVTVLVRDDDHATAEANRVITVVNLPPEVELEEDTFYIDEDGVVTLKGSATDTYSDQTAGLEYMWDFGDGNTTDWGIVTEASHTYTHSGDYTAMFLVRDIDGIEVNATAIVHVANIPPIAQVTEVPVELEEDEEAQFEGLGIDTPTDTETLEYKWDFGDGAATDWSNVPSTVHIYTTEGDFEVLFLVRDNDGDEHYMGSIVTVTNPAPVVEVLSPDKTIFDEDVEVTFSGNGTDTDSDRAILNFTWTIDDVTYQGKEVKMTFTTAGEHRAVLRAEDDEGASDEETVAIRVNNIIPGARIQASATTVKEGEEIGFDAIDVTDSASDIDELEYEWSVSPTAVPSGPSDGTNITYTFEEAGSYTIRLVVKDDEGAEDIETVRVTVLPRSKGNGGDDDDVGNMAIYAGAGAAVVVVVLLVLLLLMRNKRKAPGTEIEEIEEEEMKKEGPQEEE